MGLIAPPSPILRLDTADRSLLLAPQQIHPATKLLLWLALVIASQQASATLLLALAGVLLCLLWRLRDARILPLLSRLRYVFLALALIYGYATPGAELSTHLGALSPTREGLAAGCVQALRLVVAIAALRVLLHGLDRQALLSGLLALLRPFAVVGVDWERIAVRIWLTLDYADRLGEQRFRELLAQLKSSTETGGARTIEIPAIAASWRDVLALLLAVALGLVLLA
jgi:energy-coupling factor transporter transmembrane protein EcfT